MQGCFKGLDVSFNYLITYLKNYYFINVLFCIFAMTKKKERKKERKKENNIKKFSLSMSYWQTQVRDRVSPASALKMQNVVNE